MKYTRTLLTALLLAPLAALHAAELPRTKVTIFRAVDSVRPGEAELLVGDWPATASVKLAQLNDHASGAALSWQPLRPLQVSSQSMKFSIPATWAMGAYACRVVDGSSRHLPRHTRVFGTPGAADFSFHFVPESRHSMKQSTAPTVSVFSLRLTEARRKRGNSWVLRALHHLGFQIS